MSAPRPSPGQTQAEANQIRDRKRVSRAAARGVTFVGVKGHKHAPEVLAKKAGSMREWFATDANREAHRAAMRRGWETRRRNDAAAGYVSRARRSRRTNKLAVEEVRAQAKAKRAARIDVCSPQELRDKGREILAIFARLRGNDWREAGL